MPKSQSSFAFRASEDKKKNKLRYGFLDESGILEKKTRAGEHFIISAIIIADPSELKQVMKIARQKARGKFKTHGIFKAHKENFGFIKIVLRELAKKNIKIVIGVWDKQKQKHYSDKNILYAKLLAQIINNTLNVYPRLNLIVHKRCILPRIQNQLKQIVAESMQPIKTCLFIDQKTESECKELELADAVAWAVYQKYNNKKLEFYAIIKNKIVKENRLAA